LEDLVQDAGLVPERAGEVPTPYLYPGVDVAVRAQSASGPAVRAAQHAGQKALHDVLTEVMTRYRQPDGAVRLDNVFRYLVATTTR
jgi:hypothetical protein